MRTRLFDLIEQLRGSLWFVPGIMATGAMLLAIAIVEFEFRVEPSWLYDVRWLSTGAADGARAILSTIAGSMITVAGVTFSVTVVALSLASSQFGPRLLRNFMRDRVNQTVLGMFIATFMYCAVVLRAVQSGEDGRVPYLAVTGAVGLALISLGGLIYFIHHIALSIQADQIIAHVGADLDRTIERLFPEIDNDGGRAEHRRAEVVERHELSEGSAPVRIRKTGYLRAVAIDDLVQLAREKEAVIQLVVRPRDFLVRDTVVARVEPLAHVDDELTWRLNDALLIGRVRTPEQDVEFCVNQLVELALRALSPGINDPGTAMLCIDRLSSSICWLGQRAMPRRLYGDKERDVRVILTQPTFDGIVDAAFHQIRQTSRGNTAVTIRMLEALQLCMEQLQSWPERCDTLMRHAQLIIDGVREAIPQAADREDVERRFKRIVARVPSTERG